MIATEAVEKNLSEEFRSLFLRHIPLRRTGLPEEIAAAVAYLANEESTYTTGQIIAVSGGSKINKSSTIRLSPIILLLLYALG